MEPLSYTLLPWCSVYNTIMFKIVKLAKALWKIVYNGYGPTTTMKIVKIIMYYTMVVGFTSRRGISTLTNTLDWSDRTMECAVQQKKLPTLHVVLWCGINAKHYIHFIILFYLWIINVSKLLTDWLTDWLDEWTNEQTNERTKELRNKRKNERTNESMNQWINESMPTPIPETY